MAYAATIDTVRIPAAAVAALLGLSIASTFTIPASKAAAEQSTATSVLEIRVYTLKPAMRDTFHRRFLDEVLPLLRRSNVDVVAYGPSLHDDDSYYLMRAFSSVADRTREEDAFYSSAAWTTGPRADVLAAIQTYSTAVVAMDKSGIESLRRRLECQHP